MPTYPYIHIAICHQTLTLQLSPAQCLTFPISSAKNGTGQQAGSGCTPLGRHVICEKFGDGLPLNSVFVARKFTGEIYTPALACQFPERDWILTRILWLSGCEEGVNLGSNADGSCDSKARYIYIHGTPDSEPMGTPLSHGCIRMTNQDVTQLFDLTPVGTPVFIEA